MVRSPWTVPEVPLQSTLRLTKVAVGCLDVEQVCGADVVVAVGGSGFDARHADRHLDRGIGHLRGDDDAACDVGEAAAHLRDHEVASHEREVGVSGVDVPHTWGGKQVAFEGAGGGLLDLVVRHG